MTDRTRRRSLGAALGLSGAVLGLSGAALGLSRAALGQSNAALGQSGAATGQPGGAMAASGGAAPLPGLAPPKAFTFTVIGDTPTAPSKNGRCAMCWRPRDPTLPSCCMWAI